MRRVIKGQKTGPLGVSNDGCMDTFVVLPKAFDEKTMLKIGTIPRCEPFTKFEEE
jgi:hypothetical protein